MQLRCITALLLAFALAGFAGAYRRSMSEAIDIAESELDCPSCTTTESYLEHYGLQSEDPWAEPPEAAACAPSEGDLIPSQWEDLEGKTCGWKKRYCMSSAAAWVVTPTHGTAAECLDMINAMYNSCREYCTGYCEKEYGFGLNAKCRDFADAMKWVPQDIVVKSKLMAAIKTCKPAAKDVCVEHACPIYCASQGWSVRRRRKAECNCKDVCRSAQKFMWSAFTSTCTHRTSVGVDGKPLKKGLSFKDCMLKKYKRLQKKYKRHPLLEALMRDHVGKCICVNRLSKPDADKTCYSDAGGQGIERGHTWCEFDNVPSWRDHVKPLAEKSGKLESVSLPACDSAA